VHQHGDESDVDAEDASDSGHANVAADSELEVHDHAATRRPHAEVTDLHCTNTHTHMFNGPLSPDYPGEPVPER